MILLQGLEEALRRSEIRNSCLHGDARTCTQADHCEHRAQALACAPFRGREMLLTADDSDTARLEDGFDDPLDMAGWLMGGHQKRR